MTPREHQISRHRGESDPQNMISTRGKPVLEDDTVPARAKKHLLTYIAHCELSNTGRSGRRTYLNVRIVSGRKLLCDSGLDIGVPQKSFVHSEYQSTQTPGLLLTTSGFLTIATMSS